MGLCAHYGSYRFPDDLPSGSRFVVYRIGQSQNGNTQTIILKQMKLVIACGVSCGGTYLLLRQLRLNFSVGNFLGGGVRVSYAKLLFENRRKTTYTMSLEGCSPFCSILHQFPS